MKYYTCANTAHGFVDLTEDNIFDVERVIEIKSSNDHIRNLILKLACEYADDENEKIICPATKEIMSGLIFRDKNLAIVNKCKNANKTVNLDNFFGVPEYNPRTKYIYECMYNSFYEGKMIHDKWEEIYINCMNFSRFDRYLQSVLEMILTGETGTGTGKTYKRFFGTVLPEGNVNYIDSITQNINKRYFIKGRPGTGKSTFMKKLSKLLKERNFDVEEYYCSFDKESLDMVVSRELFMCVFDSTPPHEKFPERPTDEILDFYINAGLDGVDEKFEKELTNIKASYDMKIKEGKSFCKIATELKEASEKQMLSCVKDDDLAEIIKLIFN